MEFLENVSTSYHYNANKDLLLHNCNAIDSFISNVSQIFLYKSYLVFQQLELTWIEMICQWALADSYSFAESWELGANFNYGS